MYKIINFTTVAIIVFSLFVTYNAIKPEKDLPTNAPFIIKYNQPGICRVSTLTIAIDIKQNKLVVACEISIATLITSGTIG